MERMKNNSGWKPVLLSLYVTLGIFFFLFIMMIFVRWQNKCDSLLPWNRNACKESTQNL
jgi:hypothetical protein